MNKDSSYLANKRVLLSPGSSANLFGCFGAFWGAQLTLQLAQLAVRVPQAGHYTLARTTLPWLSIRLAFSWVNKGSRTVSACPSHKIYGSQGWQRVTARDQHWLRQVKLPGSSRLVKDEREERSARSGSSGPLEGSEADTWLLQLLSSTACRAALSSAGDAFSEDLSERYIKKKMVVLMKPHLQQGCNKRRIITFYKISEKKQSKHFFNEGYYLWKTKHFTCHQQSRELRITEILHSKWKARCCNSNVTKLVSNANFL